MPKPLSQASEMCTVNRTMVEKEVSSPLAAVLSVFVLNFQPERDADGTTDQSRWNLSAAGPSMGLVP